MLPTKTLAVRLFEYGGPEKLVVGDYALPQLGGHDVLVKNSMSVVGGKAEVTTDLKCVEFATDTK